MLTLSFMSKLIERAVTAYKSFHSTETALLCVQNDILKATNDNSMTMLLLLDLSATFDTIDFNILLSRLRNSGIRDNCLSWFQDYLTGRSQVVCLQKMKSSPKELKCEVPQGSVLGPLFFPFTQPLLESWFVNMAYPTISMPMIASFIFHSRHPPKIQLLPIWVHTFKTYESGCMQTS